MIALAIVVSIVWGIPLVIGAGMWVAYPYSAKLRHGLFGDE